MEHIEKERNKKLKEELANQLKIVKLQAQERRYNEQKLKEELGIQNSLIEFHKPVIEKMNKLEEKEDLRLQSLKDGIEYLSQKPPQLDYTNEAGSLFDREEGFVRLNFDKDLDFDFLKREKLRLPSELINETDNQLDKIITSAKEKRDSFKRYKANSTKNNNTDKIREYDYKMKQMKFYIKALETLKTGNYYIGQGLDSNIDLLDKLTDKICKGSKSKKVYNQIVVLLDLLLKKGEMTNEQVKQYYQNFLS